MPRRAKVRWHKSRRRWYANIGERGKDGRAREVYAPPDIGEKEESRAWAWFDQEKARREAVPVASDDVTAEWVCEHYLAWAEARRDEGKLAPEHYANKERHLGLFCDALGSRVARTLEAEDLTAFLEGLLGTYARTYVKNIGATVNAAFNWAVRPGKHLPANPIRGFTAPTVPRSPVRFAERVEAAAFLGYWRTADPRGHRGDGKPRKPWRQTVRGRYERLTILLDRVLIRTGARPGELCKLKWADIQWSGWTASSGHICAKAVIPPERWKAGKVTGKPRTIYFTPILTRALRRVWERGSPNEEWVFVHAGGRGGQGAGQPWPSGSRLSKTILRVRRGLIAHQVAIRERIQAGDPTVQPWERRRAAVRVLDAGHDRLTNYRFRHTAISTLLMLGVDVPTVAELTGTSPEMIYKFYGHLLDQHLASAAEKLIGSGKRRPR